MLQALRGNKYFLKLVSYGGLFTSFGTLICCAIPSTLVLLGFGATLANLIGVFPQVVWLSENKNWVFGISSLMLIFSYLAQRYSAEMACPIDKKDDCEATKNWSKPLFVTSVFINVIGGLYASVLPRLLQILG